MVDILDVARYTLTLGPMTQRKLQILCFYMQVWHIVFKGEKFMNTDFEAWMHGPTSERLYERYYEWGALVIPQTTYSLYNLKLSEQDKAFIKGVYDLYKNYSTEDMKILSKKETPYLLTRKNLPKDAPCKAVIHNEIIRNFYTEMLEEKDMT